MTPGSDQDGQATLELALCLPILILLVATLIQVGVVVSDQVRVWHAAREAARVAAVDPDHDRVLGAAEAGGLVPLQVEITPEGRFRSLGEPVTVTVTFAEVPRVPLVGRLIAHDLSASATMRIESP